MHIKDLNYLIVGGDKRQLELYKLMANSGYNVEITAFDKLKKNDVFECLKNAQIIIFPIPSLTSQGLLNAKFSTNTYQFHQIIKNIKSDSIIFGAKFDNFTKKLIKQNNILAYDLIERDEFSVFNSVATAEGVVQIIMENSDITIHASNSLVLGFGKSGRYISHLLNALGSKVTVEARKYSDLAWIEILGYKSVHLNNLKDELKDKHFIINTIPYMILDEEKLKLVDKSTLIIDIASKPGGVDLKAAKELGLKANIYPALPGKVAPMSSAKIIYKVLFKILSDKI